jgi:hypothetical protein
MWFRRKPPTHHCLSLGGEPLTEEEKRAHEAEKPDFVEMLRLMAARKCNGTTPSEFETMVQL